MGRGNQLCIRFLPGRPASSAVFGVGLYVRLIAASRALRHARLADSAAAEHSKVEAQVLRVQAERLRAHAENPKVQAQLSRQANTGQLVALKAASALRDLVVTSPDSLGQGGQVYKQLLNCVRKCATQMHYPGR
jgi:hypothetical protein